MSKSSEFIIENDSDAKLSIHVEPEGVMVLLNRKETIVVHDEHIDSPVTIVVSSIDTGERVLSIWPGDGDTIVRKDGHDVLDLE